MDAAGGTGRGAAGSRTLAMALAAGGLVVALVAPLPGALLDLLLAANMTTGIALLLAAIEGLSRGEAQLLPRALLISAALRFVTQVAVLRAALAGRDVGSVVAGVAGLAGPHPAAGTVAWGALALGQYLVLARGAERSAEVRARFALDAMPGRQLSVDAELRAGLVDAASARSARADIVADAAQSGAMDGALKALRGDVIGCALVFALLLGGSTATSIARSTPAVDALWRASLQAVGLATVAQVASFLVAVAATLAAESSPRGGAALRHTRALLATAAVTLAIGLLPAVPLWPFAACALVCVAVAYVGRGGEEAAPAARFELRGRWADATSPTVEGARWAEGVASRAGLTAAVEHRDGGSPREVWFRGELAAREREAEATAGGATVARLLDRGARSVARRWLTLDAVRARLDALTSRAPALVAAAVPSRVTLASLAELLARLAEEGEDLDDLEGIVAAALPSEGTEGVAELTERARRALAPARTRRLLARQGGATLRAWFVAPMVAESLRAVGASPERWGASLCAEVLEAAAALAAEADPVVIAPPDLRRGLWEILRRVHPDVAVTSPNELAEGVATEVLGWVGPPEG